MGPPEPGTCARPEPSLPEVGAKGDVSIRQIARHVKPKSLTRRGIVRLGIPTMDLHPYLVCAMGHSERAEHLDEGCTLALDGDPWSGAEFIAADRTRASLAVSAFTQHFAMDIASQSWYSPAQRDADIRGMRAMCTSAYGRIGPASIQPPPDPSSLNGIGPGFRPPLPLGEGWVREVKALHRLGAPSPSPGGRGDSVFPVAAAQGA